MRVIRASDSIFQRAGRWEAQTTRSILASWAGASLSFVWHGKRSLRLRTGPATERKDRFNGGTPNLCFNARPMRKGDPFMRTYDVDGAQEIELSNPINELAIVEIMLIDWASTLELESLLINEADDIEAYHYDPCRSVEAIFIGDSMSCGWTDGSSALPYGCLSAYPYALQKCFRQDGIELLIDLVAYPGLTLADRSGEIGMQTKFFHASPWNTRDISITPRKVSIALIALGTNDDAQDVPFSHFMSDMISFVNRFVTILGASCKHIYLVEPFPDFNEPEPVSAYDMGLVIENLSACYPERVFRLLQINHLICKDDTMDGLHLTPSGHEKLGNALQAKLRPITDSLLATESQIPYVTSELLAAIEAGVVLRNQGPSKTVKVLLSNQNAVVRYGTNVGLGEANVLKLLSTACAPGSVPVPRVIGTWRSSSSQDTRQTLYIVTEWVNGESLEDIWPQLQSSDKDALAARLSDILRCIRLVKPEGNPYIGAVDHLPCNDDVLRGMGPFTDMDAFIEAFKHVCRPYARGHYMRVLDRLLVRWRSYSVVLTHGDLCPDNILVCRTPDGNSWTVAAIVDWELAGWYPEHWEYVTLLNCIKWRSDWSSIAQDLLPAKYDDDFILDSKYRFYLR